MSPEIDAWIFRVYLYCCYILRCRNLHKGDVIIYRVNREPEKKAQNFRKTTSPKPRFAPPGDVNFSKMRLFTIVICIDMKKMPKNAVLYPLKR